MSERLRRCWIASVAVVVAATAITAPTHAKEPLVDEPLVDKPGAQATNDAPAVDPAGVHVAIGPLVASRTMRMRVDSDNVAHQPGPYLGGTARLSIELVEFDSTNAVLLLEGEGGYGATRNSETADELRRQPVTEWSFLDARITVRRPLSESLDLNVGLGAYANSFIVEPNLTYTGHRYVAADMRLGIAWHDVASSWSASADLSAHPVLFVNESSGARGESSAFGARGGAQVGYDLAGVESTGGYAGGRIMLRYDYTRFRTQFPQQRVVLDGGVSEDDVHALTLMLGYFM
jgi:hypothetical protein